MLWCWTKKKLNEDDYGKTVNVLDLLDSELVSLRDELKEQRGNIKKIIKDAKLNKSTKRKQS